MATRLAKRPGCNNPPRVTCPDSCDRAAHCPWLPTISASVTGEEAGAGRPCSCFTITSLSGPGARFRPRTVGPRSKPFPCRPKAKRVPTPVAWGPCPSLWVVPPQPRQATGTTFPTWAVPPQPSCPPAGIDPAETTQGWCVHRFDFSPNTL